MDALLSLMEFWASFGLITIIVGLIVFVVTVISQWRVFQMLGLRGWECIIPFYGTFALGVAIDAMQIAVIALACSAAGIVLAFIPVIGFLAFPVMLVSGVLTYVLQYKMLLYMGRPVWMLALSIFVPFLFWPILAFTS